MLVLSTHHARERTRIAAWQTLGDTLKPSSQNEIVCVAGVASYSDG
jgi:hypothetical protein